MAVARRVKPGFGVDVDNVLANSSGLWIAHLNESRKFEVPVKRDDLVLYPFHKNLAHLGVSQQDVSDGLDAVWKNHHLKIELLDPQAPVIIKLMNEVLDFRIEIMTTMGARHPESRDRILHEWLEMHGIKSDRVTFFNNSEEKLTFIRDENVHTIVDDQEGLAVQLVGMQQPGIVYSAPWNGEFRKAFRVKGADGALPIAHIADNWGEVGRLAVEMAAALRS